jgi:predicted metal-dependent phosphoesterase TrpH
MPTRQPFTALCRAAFQATSGLRPDARRGRSDLHVHTVHSDGSYTPSEAVELARRAGLAALALTDHDTLAGVAEARTAAAGTSLEIVPGVEISTDHGGREFHLLAYFVAVDDGPLGDALHRLRQHRTERFWDMVDRLRGCGVSLDEGEVRNAVGKGVLGRRHLAELLVRARRVGSVREAFARYLGDGGRAVVPKVRLPVREALDLVRGAGGVASWAHPPANCTRENLTELHAWGLRALEVEYPACRASRTRQLRGLARELALAVTGGSDCHGPGNYQRDVGARGVTEAELEHLRQAASVFSDQ